MDVKLSYIDENDRLINKEYSNLDSFTPVSFPCQCYDTMHFLRILPDTESPGMDVEFVSTVDKWTFWQRVKWAWRTLWSKEELIVANFIFRDTEQILDLAVKLFGYAKVEEYNSVRKEKALAEFRELIFSTYAVETLEEIVEELKEFKYAGYYKGVTKLRTFLQLLKTKGN